jgi:hypothetical protein
MIRFIKDDGGRAASGYKGKVGDCAVRAVAIATRKSYHKVYAELAFVNFIMPKTGGRTTAGLLSAAHGIYTNSVVFKRYMKEQGFIWTPTMDIGTGCKVHLHENELPMGRLVARVSKHLVAVIDRVVHDTHDSTRGGTRCVYGYWKLEK